MVEVKKKYADDSEEYELRHDVTVVDPEVLPGSAFIGYMAPIEDAPVAPVVDFASVSFEDADPMIRDIVGPIMQNAWNHYQAGMQIVQRMQQNAGHY